jgi:hypothetical protein
MHSTGLLVMATALGKTGVILFICIFLLLFFVFLLLFLAGLLTYTLSEPIVSPRFGLGFNIYLPHFGFYLPGQNSVL